MSLEFRPTTNPTGIEVVDTLAQSSFHLGTSSNAFTEYTDDVPFSDYVTDVVEFETEYIEFDEPFGVTVRDSELQVLDDADYNQEKTYPQDNYVFKTKTTVNFYIQVEGKPTLVLDPQQTKLQFGTTRSVVAGCRSVWTTPREQITTTTEPEDLATALSALSSSLTTVSPERSWPSLRNHPPTLEFGDELYIPPTVTPPETGITIVVPPRYGPLLTAAPLAYYLGATLELGRDARIETSGCTRPLGQDRPFEDDVVRLVQSTFVLDCLVRGEGMCPHWEFYDPAIVDQLPFDRSWAFDATPAERFDAYESVGYETLEELVPRWSLVAYLPPTTDSFRALPHVLDRLGLVRIPSGEPVRPNGEVVSGFLRETNDIPSGSRSKVPAIEPARSENAVTHAWFGPGTPFGASQGAVSSYENAIRNRAETDVLNIAVVCAEKEMLAERASIGGLYDGTGGLERDVSFTLEPTADELAERLRDGDIDLFHFIGHATQDGLHCEDRSLDVFELDNIGPRFFVLNACETNRQAIGLVERGSLAGVATHAKVANSDATRIGRNVAGLLGSGFPISGAVEQGTIGLEAGSQYQVVGDGNARVIANRGTPPVIKHVEPRGDETYAYSMEYFLTNEYKIGSLFTQFCQGEEEFLLGAGLSSVRLLSRSQVFEELGRLVYPVRFKDRLYWPETDEDIESMLEG
ncbi:hypothetical protein [Haloarchaeobius sp. DFWS5]|uniref:hypothetical protein n=1 Tax=Haloarchaeobius sp. DFWS5 TaxID=3446114 RepID=UPI003EBC4224